MAEKAAGKKEQPQKNKKWKQQEKKKSQENGMKHPEKKILFFPEKKKKNKGCKNKNSINNINNSNTNKTSKKKLGSGSKSFVWVFFTRMAFILIGLGFIYLVDYDQFVRIVNGAGYCVNKTISFLPPEVVTKGSEAVEYVRPVAEIAFNKVNVLLNETSTFFNSNPLIKDHWTNVREISLICSARLVDYMRTLYVQTIGYCDDVKKKLFQ